MKWIFMMILSIFFPWIIILMNDDPVGALIALLMQVTLIGWIPAIIWARRSIQKAAKKKATVDENQET